LGLQLKQLGAGWGIRFLFQKILDKENLLRVGIRFFLKPVIMRFWRRLKDFSGKKIGDGLYFALEKLV
jgi:hypothetical protein